MKKEVFLLGVASLFASSLALAQTSLEELDKDGDKNVSQQEAQTDKDLSANFSQWDADNNSMLSQEEFKAYQERAKGAGGQQQQQQQGAGGGEKEGQKSQ